MKYLNIKCNSINNCHNDKLNADNSYYDNILLQVSEKISQLKKNCCERLYDNIKNDFKSHNHDMNGTFIHVQDSCENDGKNHALINRNDVGIFGELTPKMLTLLNSDKIFTSKQINERPNYNTTSLYPVNDTSYSTESCEIFNSSSTDQSLMSRNSNDICEIKKYLPFGDIYFDREYYFMEIFKVHNSQ